MFEIKWKLGWFILNLKNLVNEFSIEILTIFTCNILENDY